MQVWHVGTASYITAELEVWHVDDVASCLAVLLLCCIDVLLAILLFCCLAIFCLAVLVPYFLAVLSSSANAVLLMHHYKV